jgi:hypothetical protein
MLHKQIQLLASACRKTPKLGRGRGRPPAAAGDGSALPVFGMTTVEGGGRAKKDVMTEECDDKDDVAHAAGTGRLTDLYGTRRWRSPRGQGGRHEEGG